MFISSFCTGQPLWRSKEPIETVEEQRELYHEQADIPVKGEVFFPTAFIKISPWTIVSLTVVIGLTLTFGPRRFNGACRRERRVAH